MGISLRPPPIEKLAGYIQDGQYVDMRVCDQGRFERVMPLNLTIHRDHDELEVRQDVPDGKEVQSRVFRFDCEDIMTVQPTVFELDDVEAAKLEDGEHGLTDEALAREILQTVAFMHGATANEIKDGTNETVWYRQLCIRLMWEVSKRGQSNIPQLFGYSSGGTTHNALYQTAKKPDHVLRLHSLLQTRLGVRLPFVRALASHNHQESIIAPTTGRQS
jgi:hypothetical protein